MIPVKLSFIMKYSYKFMIVQVSQQMYGREKRYTYSHLIKLVTIHFVAAGMAVNNMAAILFQKMLLV